MVRESTLLAKAAINSAAEVLSRRIERYKGRTYRSERDRKGSTLANKQAEDIARVDFPAEGELLADGNLVRIKKFEMQAMTVEAAVFSWRLTPIYLDQANRSILGLDQTVVAIVTLVKHVVAC